MLDETTCPVCGKDLREDFHQAVAHYLAHLVDRRPTLNVPDGKYIVRDGFWEQIDARVDTPIPVDR